MIRRAEKYVEMAGAFTHFVRMAAAIALAFALAFALTVPAGAYAAQETEASAEDERIDAAITACIEGLLTGWEVPDPASLYASEMLDVEDGTCVWMAFDAYRAGVVDAADDFLTRMENSVSAAYAGENAGIDPYSPTSWGRTAIVVSAFGGNPTAFGTKPDGAAANLLSDGLYNWSYTENLGDQGSNAYIYALQALDACGAEVPADAKYSEQDMLSGLLSCQAEDGSFALTPGSTSGSVDLTGMALAALGAYRDDPAVADAIERAVAYLSEQQQPNGGFAAEGEETSESCAMVVVGLAACGIDPAADARFAKEGGSVLDALLAFQKADGTFAHTAADVSGTRMQDLPTEQALRALLAFEDLAAGGDGNVYTVDVALDFSQTGAVAATDVLPGWSTQLVSMGVGAAAALVLVIAIWAVRKARRKARNV